MHLNPKNPVTYGYTKDLDQAIVEIEHVDVATLKLATPPKNEYRLRHVSLATTNMKRAVNFYSTLLETKHPRQAGRLFSLKGEKIDQISGLENSEIAMAWFQTRNLELEIIQYLNPKPNALAPRPFDAAGYNLIMFNVTDLSALKTKLLAAGGQIILDEVIWDNTETLFARDPDGNLLGFQSLGVDSPYSAKHFKDNGTS